MKRYAAYLTLFDRRSWERGLFWAWNIVFLAFMLLGFAPLELPTLIQSVREGITPPLYLVFCLALILIPVLAVLVGALWLRRSPERLFALGYAVEWPLLLILMFRFFLIRQGNPAITVLLVWLGVAEAAFLWHLLDARIEQRGLGWQLTRLAGLTLLFAGTLYAAGWLLFYVPPFAWQLVQTVGYFFKGLPELFANISLRTWYSIPLSIVGIILFIFSGSLLVVMPVVAPVLAGRAALLAARAARRVSRWEFALAAGLLPLVLVGAALGVGMRQPQQEAFRLLENVPASPQQANYLVQHESQLREGLLNAYLAPFRYMSAVGEVRHVSDMYQSFLRVSPGAAWNLERAYEVFIRPFLYVPVHSAAQNSQDNQVFNNEPLQAADLYQNYFDQPIIKAERETIVNAVRSTSDGSQAEAAWQAVDDHEVHLNQQEVTLAEHGDWAQVTIHEVYENHTFTRQEVVYYFNLPESAVVTGLWLGNSPDREKAFPYQVAPRGSAQAVYRNEVRLNRDPALVEQIGPRQYRLRAFPVEPRTWSGSDRYTPGPELHLWLEYRTVAVDGAWPLPQLAEKSNVYWDGQTTRLVNGTAQRAQAGGAWLPSGLPAAQAVTARSHQVQLATGQTVWVRPAAGLPLPAPPEGLRLAVVLDRSFSMRSRAAEVEQTLADLKQLVKAGPDPDLYLTASKYRGEAPGKVGLASLNPAQISYFGGQNAAELLEQFESLQGSQVYDAILVLTDGSGFEIGTAGSQVRVPGAPVWVVHLGGGLPLGYDDPTLQAIQASGGGVADTVAEALGRYAYSRNARGARDVLDGYVWEVLPAGQAAPQAAAALDDPGFAALAARRLILAEMARNQGRLDQLPVLDSLQRLAEDASIVTPYSSMLVLVNQLQQDQLELLSDANDRYQREVENVGNTTRVNPFAVTGVPEPEEWLLLLLAGLLLGYTGWRAYQRSRAPVRLQ